MITMNRARKWLAASALLAASGGLGLWGLGSPATVHTANAAAPLHGNGSSLFAPLEQAIGVRRESAPPSSGPAPRTGPASPYNPLDIPNFGPNYRANTDSQSPNLAQQEPSISINPTNVLNVVAAAKDERGGSNTKQIWIYTSTDGGVTWINQIFPFLPPASPNSSDPIVSFSDDGICYVTALPYGGGPNDGIQVARSLDGGITFSTGVHLPGTSGSSDKEWTWVDNYPLSPYYHNIYVAWMIPGSSVNFNRSTDRGLTWSTSINLGAANQFPMPVVLPNGDVIVTYRSTGGSVVDRRSTNGGVSFGAQQAISAVTSPNCPPDNSGCGIWRLSPIPANSVDRRNGDMVVMWADGTGGAATIRYSRSTNSGASWSATSAVLAPSGVAGTYQVEPWVEADENGIFHAVWYDDRENPNTSIFNIYYSQSTDDGATWSSAVRITTATTNLAIGIPSSYNLAAGDYINVTAAHGNVYAVWTDTRSGTGEDIYVTHGTYGGGTTPTATPTTIPPTGTPTFTNTPVPTSTPTNTAVPTNTAIPTDTATNTPTPTAIVRGHVLLQARPAPPDPRWSVPVTLTLHTSDGSTSEYTGLITDNNGYFTVTGVLPGSYSWRTKNPQTLANSGNVTLVQGGNTVEMGTLAEGDANNDNCVNVTDFSILKNTFGKSNGDPGYDPRADFNGDNAVNVVDFNLQKNNFGICGADPIK